MPWDHVDYIHRIGRTARAGASGTAITFVTQSDVGKLHMIERAINQTLPQLHMDEDRALFYLEEATKAKELAKIRMLKFGKFERILAIARPESLQKPKRKRRKLEMEQQSTKQ
eukprot:TRINITY_DN7632_c0_g1_i1.p1 TRINITY_DN7632_c0_g1~~TRINITY_DN7632_c0_g1_i1.p1  ORF type:complete len:113 (+),score=15.04 TRINITY_DN7632_c0_g1_i1:249-587(+)